MRMEGLGHHPDKGRSNMHKLMSKDNESLEMRTKPVKKQDQRALWEQAASHHQSTSQRRTKSVAAVEEDGRTGNRARQVTRVVGGDLGRSGGG